MRGEPSKAMLDLADSRRKSEARESFIMSVVFVVSNVEIKLL